MKNKGFKIVLTVLLVLLLAAGGYLLWLLKPWEEKPGPGTESSASIESERSEESEESTEVFPAETSDELGLYVETASNGIRYVVDDHHERQSDYTVDEDGNIRTVSGEPVIAAENTAAYSVITEIVDLFEENIVVLGLYNLGKDGFAYDTTETEFPLTMNDAVDTRWTAELIGGDCLADLQAEEGGIRFTALHSGTAKIRIRNAAGEIIAELPFEVILAEGMDEATEELIARVSECSHDYLVTVVEPTFERGGYTIHECLLCGHVFFTDETPVKDCEHEWGEEIVHEATCSSGGYTSRTCALCGKEERTNETEPAPHTWGAVTTVAPTCSSEGYSVHTCTVCGTEERFDIRSKLAHTYTDTVVAPTYREKGYTEHKCSVCGYTFRDHETAKIPCPGHNYEVTEHTDPTCTAKGRTVKVCSICGKTETTETAALGHEWSSWVETQPATEESTGTKQRTCTRCHQTETQTIPMICLHHEADSHGWYGLLGADNYFGGNGPADPTGTPCKVDSSHTHCPYTYYWYATCRKCGETFYRQATQYDQVTEGHDSLVLDRLYYYLNQYRATYAGMGPLTRDSRYEIYSEIRADQLVFNFSHDDDDQLIAERQAQTVGSGCSECIGYIPYVRGNSIDVTARAFIDGFYHSSAHWAILTYFENTYVGIGFNSDGYVCIEVSVYSGAESHQRYLDSLNESN